MANTPQEREFIAYEIHPQDDMPVEPATMQRSWMEVNDRFAYRCLPLSIANQNGWVVRNPIGFSVEWNGGLQREDTVLQFDGSAQAIFSTFQVDGSTGIVGEVSSQRLTTKGPLEARISSHFGNGILTFSLPYLFRTPSGVNLWVKGPANWIKPGIQALEGVVESDWSPATFTMNWKLTVVGQPVRFERGDPICMVVPIQRGLLESLIPRRVPLANNAELHAEYEKWHNARNDFIQGLRSGREDIVQRKWEKDYFRGQTNSGKAFPEHQTRLELRPFYREGCNNNDAHHGKPPASCTDRPSRALTARPETDASDGDDLSA